MFLLSQNDENQSENGSKNSKIRLRARPPAEPQKKMLQIKKLRSKSWKTRVFFTFCLPILDGRVHEQVSSVLFFTVFFEGEHHDLSKTGGFGRKMPPPGKPVTFYECHPDDHAPAPSVRADLNPCVSPSISIQWPWALRGPSEDLLWRSGVDLKPVLTVAATAGNFGLGLLWSTGGSTHQTCWTLLRWHDGGWKHLLFPLPDPQNVMGCMGCLGSTELGEPIMVAVFHSIATLMSGNVP